MFFIYETQTKPNGEVNCVPPVVRSTTQLGKAYFYDRCAKACGSTQFTSVGVLLADADMNILAIQACQTSYVPPEPEPEPEPETSEE